MERLPCGHEYIADVTNKRKHAQEMPSSYLQKLRVTIYRVIVESRSAFLHYNHRRKHLDIIHCSVYTWPASQQMPQPSPSINKDIRLHVGRSFIKQISITCFPLFLLVSVNQWLEDPQQACLFGLTYSSLLTGWIIQRSRFAFEASSTGHLKHSILITLIDSRQGDQWETTAYEPIKYANG